MAALHIVNRPSALESCLGTASADDVVLLIEDAALNRKLSAIGVDVHARGLAARVREHVTIVTYADFVQLVEVNNPIVTWR
jgi:sulfur transfer complex TusBCD TusB component (DsrH family)